MRISAFLIWVGLFLSFLSSTAALAQGCPQADGISRVNGQLECLVIRDSSRGGLYDRHFKHFQPFASPDTVFVGMIRPGYADAKKNASSGDKMGGGDNYTAHNVDAVANALQTLKTKYGA
ncbi:MAG: hypothetical protein RI918_445, partial [Pseudomonadota bacterium]